MQDFSLGRKKKLDFQNLGLKTKIYWPGSIVRSYTKFSTEGHHIERIKSLWNVCSDVTDGHLIYVRPAKNVSLLCLAWE